MNLFKNIHILKQLTKSYPNDEDLGKIVRKSFPIDEFVKSIPNDRTLGTEIRKKINSK
jgi:hypothetical protein